MNFKALRSRDLNQLKVLLALLTMRSVTRAAQELDVSQPAVSKALDRLRRELGDPLLVREGNHMRLTQRAQTLLPKVEAALSQVAGLFAAQGPFDPAIASGRVRIGANDYVQIVLGTRLLRRLRERAPGLTAEFRPVGMIQPEHLLSEGLVDIAIGPNWPNISLRSQLLYRDPFVCVAAADNHLVPASLGLVAFCAQQHLDVSPSGAGMLRSMIDSALGAQGARREVRSIVSSFMSVPAMLEGGNFVALVPKRVLALYAPSSVRIVDLTFNLPAYEVTLWWHNVTHADPLARWVRIRRVSAFVWQEGIEKTCDAVPESLHRAFGSLS